jgi:hypothetical protein
MSDKLEIVKSESQLPSVANMLQAVIQQGVTEQNVAALERLCGLYERMQASDAEKQFAAAFVGLQAEMPKVNATKAVPNNDGTTRYKFAPFEEIMRQVTPMLQKYGFTVSFSNRYEENRLVETCTLQHVEGHKRSNDFAVRIGSGPPKASESQADGAAATYAKRFALTDALNIVVEHLDNDARMEGAAITPEQAKALRDRVLATGSSVELFLKYAGADSFETIPSARYALLDQSLRKKEKVS